VSTTDRLYRRILMALAPAIVTATDDTGPVHKAQMRVNGTPEQIDGVPLMTFYGLASHQPVGSDAVALFACGLRANGVIVSTNNQKFRLRNLKSGEVALYTDEGDSIKLARGKIVAVTAGEACNITTKNVTIDASGLVTIKARTKVRVESPRLECTGDIVANVA
jgi:phage gp45-like